MSDTPIVLTKQAALQIREALAGLETEKAALAAQLKTATDKAAADLAAAAKESETKVAAAKAEKPDLTKVAGELADRMLRQRLIGQQYRDKTAENLADPVKLAGYLTKALDLLEKQAAVQAPPRLGTPSPKTAAAVGGGLAEANAAFERAVGVR